MNSNTNLISLLSGLTKPQSLPSLSQSLQPQSNNSLALALLLKNQLQSQQQQFKPLSLFGGNSTANLFGNNNNNTITTLLTLMQTMNQTNPIQELLKAAQSQSPLTIPSNSNSQSFLFQNHQHKVSQPSKPTKKASSEQQAPVRRGSGCDIKLDLSSADSYQEKIKAVVDYIVATVGKANDYDYEMARKQVENDEGLCKLFDVLIKKYEGSVKTKENITKYIFRKVFKIIREDIILKHSEQMVPKVFVDTYFPNARNAQKRKNQTDEDIFNSLMPFKENSKNKTMNLNFLTDMFSSDAFTEKYTDVANKLFDYMNEDNVEKMEKFIPYIERCLQRNQHKDIIKFNRLPWLKIWMEKTQDSAFEMVRMGKENYEKTHCLNYVAGNTPSTTNHIESSNAKNTTTASDSLTMKDVDLGVRKLIKTDSPQSTTEHQ